MDFTQVLSVLKLSWDLPWRVAASVAIMATCIGAVFDRSALESISEVALWLGTTSNLSTALENAHDWLGIRGSIFGPVGLALQFIALVFAGAGPRYRGSRRAPASVLLGAAVAAESGWALGAIWLAGGVFGLWIISVALRVTFVAKNPDVYLGGSEAFLTEERLRRTWLAPLVAAFYIPLAPLTWAIAK